VSGGPAVDFGSPAGNDSTVVTDLTRQFEAMASVVTVTVGPRDDIDGALATIAAVFTAVERACTRFDPDSPLMAANRAACSWQQVPQVCFTAVEEAYRAYLATDGLFDPRVLRSLVSLGYDRSFAFDAAPSDTDGAVTGLVPMDTAWQPAFDAARCAVQVGPHPIDLGGIGKGLALRWSAEQLRDSTGRGTADHFLIEAGGDCYLGGAGPAGAGWLVGVEDPSGGAAPVAVLAVTDLACATTSTRIRRWRAGGTDVHHIIDPRTGRPADGKLASVTVLDPDPGRAEVCSKTLLLRGLADIEAAAAVQSLAALWVDTGGRIGFSPALAPSLRWLAKR
jgi:thiamine biosynthesis lipoprotein